MLTDTLRAGIGVLRIGVGIGTRVASAGLRSTTRVTSRVLSAARNGESATDVVQDTVAELRASGRELLGVGIGTTPTAAASRDDTEAAAGARRDRHRASSRMDAASLRERGADLLRQSVDLDYEEPFHPAYARILDLLAPDEARILRHLSTEGPAAAVDVRARSRGSGSEMVAPGVTLIGDHAGCRFPDRVPGYLNNLYRLGLIWFSREELDADRYQALEAQPAVQEALKQAKRTTTVRRRIELTPFGMDFCETCIPTDDVI